MASQYLFGGVKSRNVPCLYPIRESHGVSDFLGQLQGAGTVRKIAYVQQVILTRCMRALLTATCSFIVRNFIAGEFLFAFRFGGEPFMKSPLEFLFPFFLTGQFFSSLFAFVRSRMLCQCTPPLWLDRTLYHGRESECLKSNSAYVAIAGKG